MIDADSPQRIAAEAALAERTRIVALLAETLEALRVVQRRPHFTEADRARYAAGVVEAVLVRVEAGERVEP